LGKDVSLLIALIAFARIRPDPTYYKIFIIMDLLFIDYYYTLKNRDIKLGSDLS